MAKIWHNRILAGTRTYGEVPMTWKGEVRALFRLDVLNGLITTQEYERYTGEPY